jgi:rubredoxin
LILACLQIYSVLSADLFCPACRFILSRLRIYSVLPADFFCPVCEFRLARFADFIISLQISHPFFPTIMPDFWLLSSLVSYYTNLAHFVCANFISPDIIADFYKFVV